MTESERIESHRDALRRFVERHGPLTAEEAVELAKEIVNSFLESEGRATALERSLDIELTRFKSLREKLIRSEGTDDFFRMAFLLWVSKSENTFAAAYRLGRQEGYAASRIQSTRRATNGRRLIGATSRERVRQVAEEYRDRSKENAADAIAHKVGLAPGTVRRYLTELFPGQDW